MSVLLAELGCATAVAACGSGSKRPTAADPANYASFLRFSECMRSHGVPSFPDPSPGGGGLHITITPSSGFNPESPAFQSAQQTCKHLLPGGGPPRHVPETVKLALFRHAECMRAHGVPNYRDPTFPAGGGVEHFFSSSVDTNSPAFRTALKTCGGRE
jgi:hypothetical protein